jgi:hypothetical protein
MQNFQKTKKFLSSLPEATKTSILKSIATHYGTTPTAIYTELTSDGAEHLCDYITGDARFAVRNLMQIRGCL